MNCPKCNAELIDGARFCGVCGQRLEAEGMLTLEPNRPAPAGKRGGMPNDSPPMMQANPYPFATDDGRDPYIGKVLGRRFTIEEKLGEGGFGAVYRGTQSGTGRQVAVKLLHPEMTRDKNVVARFRREGEVLCSLRDAHTITTYDFDQNEDGTLFIAMELLSGRSLHDVFKAEAPISWQRMLGLVEQMCSSLYEAHMLGIVHRDLKPENIHLEVRPGHPEFVKILDFGIAKVLRGDGSAQPVPQLTATGQTLGTLEYMSPEQLMGKQLDGRSDVYALGVLIHEMITGQLPFPNAIGPAQLIAAQLKTDPPKPSSVCVDGGIPAAVDELVLRALQKNRKDRFTDVQEMRDEIVRILESGGDADAVDVPLAAPPSGPQAPVMAEPAFDPSATVDYSSSWGKTPVASPAPYVEGPRGWAPDDRTARTAISEVVHRRSSAVIWLFLGVTVIGALVGAALALR